MIELTKKQRENLAKFLYDAAKLVLAINVLGPIVAPAKTLKAVMIVGGIAVFLLAYIATVLDKGGNL